MKGLRALSLSSFESRVNTMILKELVRDNGFSEMKEIKVCKIDKEGLHLLRQLGEDNSLRKIGIDDFEDDCKTEDVNRLLLKHKKSLEETSMYVSIDWENHFWPELPSLKKEMIYFRPPISLYFNARSDYDESEISL